MSYPPQPPPPTRLGCRRPWTASLLGPTPGPPQPSAGLVVGRRDRAGAPHRRHRDHAVLLATGDDDGDRKAGGRTPRLRTARSGLSASSATAEPAPVTLEGSERRRSGDLQGPTA